MSNRNLLFQSIFNRKFSDEDIRIFLDRVTKDHPYFSPAQYFLLLLADKESTAYAHQVAKTSVLFNNPHWLKFQLEEYKRLPTELSNSIVSNNNEVVFAENQAIPHPEFEGPLETTNENEVVVFDSFEKETIFQEPEDLGVNSVTTEQATEAASTPNELEKILTEKIENEVNEVEIEQIVEVTSMHTEDRLVVNEENDTQVKDNELAEKKTTPEIKETVHSGHFNNDNIPLVNEAETEEDLSTEKEEIVPLNFRLNIDTSGITDDTISFEPLHATDYFASLGIKLSGEIQPTDKLGKQLKSFTEWLKTMKKIHSDQPAPQNGQAELIVQKLAENSNKEQEVVTESMAEVLLQQGKAKKAIEVYKKLSLLDSSKSAYFASKIDQLKEH